MEYYGILWNINGVYIPLTFSHVTVALRGAREGASEAAAAVELLLQGLEGAAVVLLLGEECRYRNWWLYSD